MAVTVYRSSDTNAPPLNGTSGKLIDVLDACLVNGYGSVFATGTITSSGVNVSNNDTVTVGTKTYTFKTSITVGNANEVLIGANAAASLVNLQATINLWATAGTTYPAVTLGNADIWASAVTATVLTLTARKGGTGGNSLALSKVAATLSVSAATLTGGSGSDTTAGSGWTKPYSGTTGQAVYQPASGIQDFFHVDDSVPNTTARGKEAQFRGSEGATAFQTATNYYPTVAQEALLSGLVIRKSATLDATASSWIVVADGRTCYLFIISADAATIYGGTMMGDFYSILSTTDLYNSGVIGRKALANTALSTANETFSLLSGVSFATATAGFYIPRIYTGLGTATNVGKFSDYIRMATALAMGGGGLTIPHAIDGALHIAPVHVGEAAGVRGRLRGMFSPCHGIAGFADGDTITGSGAYAGRTFLYLKIVGGTVNGAVAIDITGPWETN